MGSTLVGPTIEDVDDVDLPSSHVIHIHEPDASSASTTATADAAVPMSAELSLLDEKFSLLLAAHSREAAAVSARMDALEALKLADLMAAAAASANSAASSSNSAAASAAQSAAEAALLVKSAREAVETATAVMGAAKEAIDLLASDEFIQEQLEEHARNAALAIRQVVVSESAQAAAAVSADVKKAVGKKR